MRILIDSHILLWSLQEPHKIGNKARNIMQDASERYVSIATIWELGLKHQKGNLDFSSTELIETVEKLGMRLLKIDVGHIVVATSSSFNHKDPFDNMLLAQAKAEGLPFITSDRAIISLGLPYVIEGSR